MNKAWYGTLLTVALVGGSLLPSTATAAGHRPAVDRPEKQTPGVSALAQDVEQAAQQRPRLEQGMRGPAVVYVQQRLDVRPTSGYYGPLTRAAVERFQRQHDLNPNGRVTKRVWTALLGPTPEAAAKARPRLQEGMRGPAVVYVQQRLDVRPTSGYYGPLTRAAVEQFQRQHDLNPNGRVTRRAWTALLGPTPEAAAKARPRLQEGMRGPAVVYVQQRLDVRPTSGYYGPLTRAAVERFQRQHDLNPNGRVTRRVWTALVAPVPQELTPREAAEARPRLKKGTRGPAVVYVQERLDVTPVSGYYGRLTRKAVKRFQRQHDLNPNGRVTKNVWTALLVPAIEDLSPEQAAARRPPLYRGMGPGHPAVIFVQRYLNVSPDSGFYGTLTTAAVSAYQKGLSLRVKGRVNPATWDAILAGRRPPVATPPGSGNPRPRGNSAAERALAYALAQVGKPYVLGGNGPNVFDCSGLVQQAYLSVGISLPRLASQQRFAGTRVSINNLKPGDLLYYQDGPSPRSGHISMYAGDGMAVEAANPRRGVRMRGLHEPWYRDRFVAATRVV